MQSRGIILAAIVAATGAACEGQTLPETRDMPPKATSTSMQFNLHCVENGEAAAEGSPTERPSEQIIRVDLDSRMWCRENCEHVGVIASIEPGELGLVSNPKHQLRINRVTGALTEIVMFPTSTLHTKADCEIAEFTGFPDRKF